MKKRKNIQKGRVVHTSKILTDGKPYYDYLFKVMDSYTGSAKVYTGISTALFGIPVFKMTELSKLIKDSSNPDCVHLMVMYSWLCLALSIISGAFYQYFTTMLIEDEVEFEGKEYNVCIFWLRITYSCMVGLLLIGAVLTGWFLLKIV
jgi:hypothetical protein